MLLREGAKLSHDENPAPQLVRCKIGQKSATFTEVILDLLFAKHVYAWRML